MEHKPAVRISILGLGILALLGLGWLVAEQRQTVSWLRIENQRLREEARELQTIRTEAVPAQPSSSQEAELQLLREENKDLLRLRNEVHQLREQQKEIDALRTANAGLLQAVQGGGLSATQQAAIAAVRREGAVLGITVRSANDAQNPRPPPAFNGAIVTWIDPASPVASSGLQVGDVIFRVEGRPIETSAQLQAEMLGRKPDDTVTLDVMRTTNLLHFAIKTRGWP